MSPSISSSSLHFSKIIRYEEIFFFITTSFLTKVIQGESILCSRNIFIYQVIFPEEYRVYQEDIEEEHFIFVDPHITLLRKARLSYTRTL